MKLNKSNRENFSTKKIIFTNQRGKEKNRSKDFVKSDYRQVKNGIPRKR